MKTMFEVGKKYRVYFRNGKEAGELEFSRLDNFKDCSYGANVCFEGSARFNGRPYKVSIVGEEGKTCWICQRNGLVFPRYRFVSASDVI